ncbi:MAG: SIR2 family protein [Sulfuricurvum sp.]
MPINNETTFLELVSSYHANPDKFVFFIGAGLSQPLFPSWGNLLKQFVAQAKEGSFPFDENEILEYIEKGENYLDIAEACVNAMGITRYREIMERIFDKNFSLEEVPESYKVLMGLSPKTIITTNYDRIPEIAGKGMYRINTNKNAPEASRFCANNKNVVFKMHGDITDQSSIILTSSDYQKIMNENSSIRLLLNSILSTKILIFVGFSLSDPHINAILDNIKSINNGITLSHYVLLNESSSFKISSFKNKYGVKVISYEPTDHSHPEVIEFLRALAHETGDVPEQIKINNSTKIENTESLIRHMNESIADVMLGTGFSVFYSDSDMYISFTPAGETKGEIQKEILSIIKLINFDCTIINTIIIYVTARTAPLINFDESQAIRIKVKVKYEDARKYAVKEISTTTLWKLIKFYPPTELSNVFQIEEEVDFPISIGIIGEEL